MYIKYYDPLHFKLHFPLGRKLLDQPLKAYNASHLIRCHITLSRLNSIGDNVTCYGKFSWSLKLL